MFDACITRWDATHTNYLEIGYSQDSTGADVVDEDIRNDVEYFGVDVYTTVERVADHFGAETFTRKRILVRKWKLVEMVIAFTIYASVSTLRMPLILRGRPLARIGIPAVAESWWYAVHVGRKRFMWTDTSSRRFRKRLQTA